MTQKNIQGSEELARKIKRRRNELKLTIEEAASRAGVGTKTWCRYEAGESIRIDKCKGICKALNWTDIINQDAEESFVFNKEDYEAWSDYLESEYGEAAARSFALGSDILLDYITQDLEELSKMPAEAHLGQLSLSWLVDSLPEQFLTRYNYDFIYKLKCELVLLRECAKSGAPLKANSVIDELLFYLCNKEAEVMYDLSDEFDDADFSYEWIWDMFGDMDIITCLYNNQYLDESHIYHFMHWNKQQFWN